MVIASSSRLLFHLPVLQLLLKFQVFLNLGFLCFCFLVSRLCLRRRKNELAQRGVLGRVATMSSVLVGGIGPATTKEELIIHFQKRKNFGGDVENVIFPLGAANSSEALVEFEDDCGQFCTVFLLLC